MIAKYSAGNWAVMMLVLVASLLFSPSVTVANNRVAFVVGIGTYDNLQAHEQLQNPLNDAEAVAEKLSQIGFQVVKAPNLTRSDFYEKWDGVLSRLSRDDTFVMFFSGHGMQTAGQNYLFPRDIPNRRYGREESLKRAAISVTEIVEDLTVGDHPHPKNSVLILDACRDNPFIPNFAKGSGSRAGLASMPESSDGLFVIYSAGSNSLALDRLSSTDPVKYSVFTRVLLPLLDRQDLTIEQMSRGVIQMVVSTFGIFLPEHRKLR